MSGVTKAGGWLCPHCGSDRYTTGIRTDADSKLRKRCFCDGCQREFWLSEAAYASLVRCGTFASKASR